MTTASSAVANTAVILVVFDRSVSVDKPVLLLLAVLSVPLVLLVLFVMLTGLEAALMASRQGPTLVHYSAQHEPFRD